MRALLLQIVFFLILSTSVLFAAGPSLPAPAEPACLDKDAGLPALMQTVRQAALAREARSSLRDRLTAPDGLLMSKGYAWAIAKCFLSARGRIDRGMLTDPKYAARSILATLESTFDLSSLNRAPGPGQDAEVLERELKNELAARVANTGLKPEELAEAGRHVALLKSDPDYREEVLRTIAEVLPEHGVAVLRGVAAGRIARRKPVRQAYKDVFSENSTDMDPLTFVGVLFGTGVQGVVALGIAANMANPLVGFPVAAAVMAGPAVVVNGVKFTRALALKVRSKIGLARFRKKRPAHDDTLAKVAAIMSAPLPVPDSSSREVRQLPH